MLPSALTGHGRGEIAWCLANGLRKSANVMRSVILKMPIQRLTANDRCQMFERREDALAWRRATD